MCKELKDNSKLQADQFLPQAYANFWNIGNQMFVFPSTGIDISIWKVALWPVKLWRSTLKLFFFALQFIRMPGY